MLLNIQIEYSEEEGSAEVRNGPAFGPTDSGDPLSMALVKNAAKKIEYLGCCGENGLNTVSSELENY